VYANAGWVSKVPIFDGVIDDVTGTLNSDPKNEEFVSVEAGLMYRSRTMPLSVAANVYRTTWKNRTIAREVTLADGTEGIVNLLGLDALHQGVEVEAAYQPLPFLRFDGAASVGDWTYTEDVSARYVPDGREPNLVEQLRLYTRDLKVGDAPQTQFALGVSVFPVDGLYMKLLGRYYTDFYAEFDPISRTVEGDRTQSWQIPGYTVFDLHAGYNLPIKSSRYDVALFANVFNVLDDTYVLEAIDNSSFNAYTANGVNHRADDAEVFLGLPTTFNLGLTVTFR
jgi:outer membrane receptor for Fe3+-dicitrate